jgi:hypothetical protein
MLERKLSESPMDTQALTSFLRFHQHTSNTTHSGRRVLRSSSLNHSKPSCAFRVHTPLDLALLDFPKLILI